MQIPGPASEMLAWKGWVEPAGAADSGGLWATPSDTHLDSVLSMRLERWGLLPTPFSFLIGPGSQQVEER